MTAVDLAQVPAQRRDPAALRGVVRGALHLQGEAEYDALVTPWNLAVAVRPAAVLLAEDAADVAACVRAAGELGMKVAVQCTGHGAAADQAGTVLVSTRALDECTVHAEERWARVGAGVKWQRVVDEAAPHGLAPLCGSSTDVGVVGYTLGGGTGPVARTHGAASDLVRTLEVVTGDGVLRRVTPSDDPDLFWGLRGGKGVLGIVTAVEFDLVEQAVVFGGGLYFDGVETEVVLRAWRDWCASLPDTATTSVAVLQLPPLPFVPPPLAGRTTVAVRYVFTGSADEGERLLSPLRDVAVPVLDGIGVLPYAAIDAVHTDPVDPMPAVETSALLRDLPDEALDVLIGTTGPGSTSPQLLVEVRQLGGAAARPSPHESAFCHRDAAFQLLAVGVPSDPWVEAHGRLLVEAMAPWATGGRLPNFAATDDPAEFARCYTEQVLARLRQVSLAYDPAGVIAASGLVR
jgi:hypothetical protein